ncbi:hypothetical protein EC991_007865 [Linnemannia zychae]|nr:hypothetical protein EC991_007865 [Linnemannia zychae]
MDSLSQLPLECLQHILRTLAQDKKQATLATLLQVNKYFASVTLPFLYSSPFRQIPFYLSGPDADKNRETFSNAPLLTATLLRRLSNIAELPKVVLLAYDIDININASEDSLLASPLSPLNYLEYIRHLEVVTKRGNSSSDEPLTKISDKLKAHLNENEFKTLYRLDQMVPKSSLPPRAVREFDIDPWMHVAPMYVLEMCLWVILRREVTWAIAQPILEQLQSLVIPVSDLDRYADAVDRLSSLEHIRFYADDIHRLRHFPTDEFAIQSQVRMKQDVSTMLEFIKEHIRLFQGRLKSVQFYCNYSKSNPRLMETRFPLEIQQDIFRLLPPLQEVTSLGPHNWMHFEFHPFSAKLDHVVMMTGLSPPGECFRIFCEHRELLQRCRSLKTLEMTSLGQGCFNWGVQEKNGMVESGIDNGEGENTHRQLVPLTNVKITEGSAPFTDEIDDIAIAFSQTLKRLTVEVPNHPSRDLHIGQGWVNLLVLTYISVSCKDNRLLIDSEFYTLCPNISTIHLTDKTNEYQSQDIVPCQPAQLAKLTLLRLIGWPALTFHPKTLGQTPQLVSLDLLTRTDRFIPPVEELNQPYYSANVPRPCWTWDWYLPHLKTLDLAGEIAFLFEFRMLRGCPALTSLTLDMISTDAQHTKVITADDLFLTSSDSSSTINTSNNNEEQQSTREHIVAPSLKSLTMRGAWIMEDDYVFAEFLLGMFPNLECLEEEGEWGGPTIDGFVLLIRTSPNKLQNVYLHRAAPSEDDVDRLCMYTHIDDIGDRGQMVRIETISGINYETFGVRRENPY